MPNKPSKRWFDQMSEKVRKGNPDYSEEQVRKTVGDIFYNKLSPAEKEKAGKDASSKLRVESQFEDESPVNAVTVKDLISTFSIDETTANKVMEILLDGGSPEDKLEEINPLVGTFGVEGIVGEYSDRSIYYLNTGDTYKTTIIYDDEDGFYLGNWGSWIEEIEDKAKYEMEKEMAGNTVISALEDVLADYEDEYVPTSDHTTMDDEALESEFYSWLLHSENGEYDVDSRKSALEFLLAKGLIKRRMQASKRVEAQAESFMFPNLFSSEAKKWLEIQTKLEAVKILGGIVSTPEQALKAIDQAIDNISKQLSMAVEPEVKRIMDTQKDKIMDEIVVDTEQNVQQPAPPIPPNAPPAPAPAAQPTPQPAPAPVEPVEAAASTHMPAKLRAAFDLAAKAYGEIRSGEWIVCGLNDESNEGIPAEFVEKEMLEEIVKSAADGGGFNLSGSVLGDYTGLSKVASIEVRSGYGVRLKAAEDASPWIVFYKEADAEAFLKAATE